jgi:mannose-1-phosphate guanylyltransferase
LLNNRSFDKIIASIKKKLIFYFMKLVIFAGGKGTRLWPLSRERAPKQFDKFFNGQSTLQLAIDRIKDKFGIENIYIQTIPLYEKVVREQIPELPAGNIIIEPARRDLAAAVCLAMITLKQQGASGAMALLWADHLMERSESFIKALQTGEELIKQAGDRFIFLGERPRFANNNLGWIHVGEKIDAYEGLDYFSFRGWKYKPNSDECNAMFAAGEYAWNPGYFITSIEFLDEQYQLLAPAIYQNVLAGNYEQAEALHFDRAIIEKVDLGKAVVIKTDMGWSDPGTLYALKEALAKNKEDNVVQGEASLLNCSDCLLYNSEPNKIIAGVGLNGMIVVNTPDALVVVPKDEVVNITNLVKQMKAEGKDKYL